MKTMIFKILLIYLIVMCWYFYSWVRWNTNMVIRTNKDLFKHFMVVIMFFIFFFIFVRLMNVFRDSKIIDLKLITLDKISIIFLGLIFIYSLRRLMFYVVKVHWYKLHCFLLSPENLPTYSLYSRFFLLLVYKNIKYIFGYLSYINVVLTFGLILVLMFDLGCNNFVLEYTFSYLVYYSLFKIIYICAKFMITKQELFLDYYNYNCYYPGNLDTSEFWLTYDSKVLSDARVYKDTAILDFDYFESRYGHIKGTEKYMDLKKIYNANNQKIPFKDHSSENIDVFLKLVEKRDAIKKNNKIA